MQEEIQAARQAGSDEPALFPSPFSFQMTGTQRRRELPHKQMQMLPGRKCRKARNKGERGREGNGKWRDETERRETGDPSIQTHRQACRHIRHRR